MSSTERAPVSILHVDDDVEFLSLTEAYLDLEETSFSVTTEPDPTAVLDTLADVDCVISDYDMPQLDGLSLLRQVRAVDPDIPFVLFTAQGSEEIASEAISAGVTDYLQKSGDPQQFTILANRVRNLVDRYRSTRRVASQQRRFRKLVENAADVITVVDTEGRFLYLSPSARHVFGYDPEELIGEVGFEYLHPDDRDYVIEEFYEAISDPTYRPTIEFRFRHPNGWRVLENRGRSLIDDADVEGFVINSHDVTERKRREKELRRQRDRLGEFAELVSHDLRNPLSVAFGQLELLAETGDLSLAPNVRQALDRMNVIIDDLLTLARQGEAIARQDPVSLSAVVDSAWAAVDTGETILENDADVVVVADETRLQQLLENLFANSVEHGPTRPRPPADGETVEHGSTNSRSSADADEDSDSDNDTADTEAEVDRPLTVRVGALIDGGDDGPYCGFFVEDDGVGIDPAAHGRIFEYGYSTADHGTGFGLAIVSQIATAHGWTVDATTAAGGGARFEITDVSVVGDEDDSRSVLHVDTDTGQ